MKTKTALVVLFFFINVSFAFSQKTVSGYRISNKIPVTGEGGWDYLFADGASGKLYISHSTMVQVMDINSKKIIATIPDTKGVHGIAVASDFKKGFISNGKDSSVTVFNTDSFNTIEKIYVTGRNPDAILYDPFSHRIFTFNGGGKNSTVIDAATDKVTGTISLNGKPEFAVSDGKGKVYVNLEDKNKIAVINSTSMQVENEWSLSPGDSPSGLAMDRKNNYLFSACDNNLMVILNAANGKVIKTLPIGSNVDGAAFDEDMLRAYSSNGDGTLTVIQEKENGSFSVLENIATQKSARTVTVNSQTHRLYLPAAEYGPAPDSTKENPHPRRSILPGTFVILEVEPVK